MEVLTSFGNYSIYIYWALFGFWENPVNGVNFFFTPSASWLGVNPLLSVTALTYLSEFALLIVGCVLLFKGKRLGGVAFILAALFETTVLLCSILFPPSNFIGVIQSEPAMQVYYLPIGAVLSAVIGVGALMLTRRPARTASIKAV